MKKIMILTLMLVMMFSLTACGNKENQNNNINNNEQKTVTDLGFKDVKAIQNFVDNFNDKYPGYYAYMVESDANTLEGTTFSSQGYSVYRILIWSDRNAENNKDSLGDYNGNSHFNNLNIRLIYNPSGQLVLLKTLYLVSNSVSYFKNDDQATYDAMMAVLNELFPKNTEEQNQKVYENLRLPKVEAIDSFELKSNYESKVDLVEDFMTHCGYTIGDSVSTILEYDFSGENYRLIVNPLGSYSNSEYVINWDIAFATPDDFLAYEAALTMPS